MANSVNKRIRTELNRPSAELIGKFKGIPAANIDDAMQRMAAMSNRIRPFAKHEMLGPAFTVKVPYGDNLMLHKAMSIAKPGDILVIQCEESTDRAIFGGLMVREMLGLGLGGIVVDGAIRDADEIAKIADFPVYASSVSPNGPYKNGPGEINYPVSVGGQVVCPGDIICADGDAVIVIPQSVAEDVAAAAKQVVEKEEVMLDQIVNSHLDRSWVDPKLEELKVEIK